MDEKISVGDTHNRRDLAYLIAGKGNGALRSGRSLRYTNQPHNKLLAALVNMFGFAITGFGDPAYAGSLAGLGP